MQLSIKRQFVGIHFHGASHLKERRLFPEPSAQFGGGGVGAAGERGEGRGKAEGAGGGGEEVEEGGVDGALGVLFEGGGMGVGGVGGVLGCEVVIVGGHGAEEGDHSFLD